MRHKRHYFLATTMAVIIGSTGCTTGNSENDLAREIAQGRALTQGCHACHTPKIISEEGTVLDDSRLLSGHPADLGIPDYDPAQLQSGGLSFNEHLTCWMGPWGLAFTKNLTPDDDTGIGTWSEKAFIMTVRTGHHLGRGTEKEMAKPMPWSHMATMNDDDLKAVYAYLQSIEPIKNQVPESISLEN